MATYRHWSVLLWRDPDDVSHCRILSPDKTEWRLISATLCGWGRCFVADQLWLMTRIREEEEGVLILREVEFSRFPHRKVTSQLWFLEEPSVNQSTWMMDADTEVPLYPFHACVSLNIHSSWLHYLPVYSDRSLLLASALCNQILYNVLIKPLLETWSWMLLCSAVSSRTVEITAVMWLISLIAY